MNEKETIRDMQKIMEYCCNVYDDKGNHIRNKCNSWDCEYYDKTNGVCCSFGLKEAKALYNEGYRNCKDKVVLSKEEKQKLLKEMYEQGKFDALADLEKDGKVMLSEGKYSDIIEDEVKTLKKDIAEYWACSDIDVVTQELHKDGYRKLDDHAIITLRKAKGLEERARKETVKAFAKELLNFINLCDDMEYSTYEKISNKIDEIAKKYGVEE